MRTFSYLAQLIRYSLSCVWNSLLSVWGIQVTTQAEHIHLNRPDIKENGDKINVSCSIQRILTPRRLCE